MISFSTWRAMYRIPWLRENREAVRILSDMFYLLVALYRADRFQEFARLRYLYFKMIDSFAQYGRVGAKNTVDDLLSIPWFRDNRRDVYRLIASYNRVIGKIIESEGRIPPVVLQGEINRDMDIFFQSFKSLIHFDEKDEDRVNKLLAQRDFLDVMLQNIHQTLGY